MGKHWGKKGRRENKRRKGIRTWWKVWVCFLFLCAGTGRLNCTYAEERLLLTPRWIVALIGREDVHISQNRIRPLAAGGYRQTGFVTVSTAEVNSNAESGEIMELEGLYAQSAVLMDADSGRVLYSKNGQEERAMASTTKIMTCILALENGNLDDVVTVSAYAAAQPEVHLGVREGEQFCLRDLLYSLMLESHNDAAVIIAEHVGVDVPGFADMMNEKARKIGCTQTHFVTPNGLDGEDEEGIHHTTAEDLARIMKYCIMDSPQKKAFLEITRTESYQFMDSSGSRSFSCVNHNAFLKMMEGALSGKTGFTGDAGYCYVGALKRDERTFIVSLLACGWPNNKGYKWSDTRKLMNYGLEYYHYQTVHQDIVTDPVAVLGGVPDGGKLDGSSSVQTAVSSNPEQAEKKVLLRDDESVAVSIEEEQQLTAPVSEGDPVGKVIYTLGEEVLFTEPIVAAESVEVRDLTWCAYKIRDLFLCRKAGRE